MGAPDALVIESDAGLGLVPAGDLGPHGSCAWQPAGLTEGDVGGLCPGR